MASPIQVCNLALSRIGIDQLIEDFLDPNTRARACNFHYPIAFEQCLQDFPWNFAQKVVQLAEVTGVTVPGYAKVYRYPVDCLRAHILTDDSGNRGVSRANLFRDVWDYDTAGIPQRAWPYVVMADPIAAGARIIATDLPEAYLWYTANVSDINQTPALFQDALAWKVASEIALVLRAEVRLHTNAVTMYGWTVSKAQVHTQLEGVTDAAPIPQTVAVRS